MASTYAEKDEDTGYLLKKKLERAGELLQGVSVNLSKLEETLKKDTEKAKKRLENSL